MRSFFKDLSYGLRMWLKTPGLTLVAVLSLAVGIGVNSTVFGFVNTIMFKPLSVPNNDGLVYLLAASRNSPRGNVSYPRYLEFSKQNDVFSGLAAYASPPMLLTNGEHTQEVSSEVVSVNYFSVFDIRLQRGQGFTGPEQSVSDPAVVISDNLWRRRFNAETDVVGKQLVVNGHSFSIVGVAPAGFTGTDPTASTDVWMPIMQWANILKTVSPGDDQQPQPNSATAPVQSGDKARLDPDHSWLQMIGRLKPGITAAQAEAVMTTIASRTDVGSRVPDSDWKVTLSPVTAIHPQLLEALPVGIVMVALTGLVLLICCVNVASLMLARAIVRRKEFAIRMALGGSRGRIVRQLLTEAVLLSIAGGALGLLFAYWTTRTVLPLLPPDAGFSASVAIDRSVLLFSFAISLLTALVFGLLPALNSFRLDLVGSLGSEAMSLGGKRRKINVRRVLVVMQIVASLVLLIATGLCLRSFQQGEAVTTSFKTDRMLLLNLNPTQYGYSIKYNKAFYRESYCREWRLRLESRQQRYRTCFRSPWTGP